MSFKKAILLHSFIVGIVLLASSQEEINFTSLTTKDGLSSNTVSAILKDRFGFLWFGTEDGLDKFDGTNFKVYRYQPKDSFSLQSNEILSLHEDHNGNLWVGTSGGSLSLYDRKKDAFINFPSRNHSGFIANNVIRCVSSDFQNKIWVGHYDGVNIVDPQTRKVFDFPLITNAGVRLKIPTICFFEDHKHLMWIGTGNGLFRYNPSTKSLTQLLHSDEDSFSLSGNVINAITEDKEGNMWIGTDAGLSMLEKSTNHFINYSTKIKNNASLTNTTVNSIAIDGEKIWIATETGLNILNTKTGSIKNFVSDYRNVHSLTAKSIRYIFIDKQGISWLGMAGGGVDKYDQNLSLLNFVKSNVFDDKGLNAPVVSSFTEYHDGNVFVGTDGGGLSLFNTKTRLFQQYPIQSKRKGFDGHLAVTALIKNNKGQIIVAAYNDGLFVVDPVTKKYRQFIQGSGIYDLNSNEIFCLKQDQRGNLWAGTNGYGINILDRNYKVITRYTPNPKFPNDVKLPINPFIRDIEEDKFGNIWIATHGGGIAVLNTVSQKFTIYNTQNSNLSNDKVLTLHRDHLENMWAGTFGGGVLQFDEKNGKFICFSESNGLQNNVVYKILEDRKGLIWVSTNKAISSIDIATKNITNYNHHNGVQNNNFVIGSGLVLSSGEVFFGGLEGFNFFNPAYLKKNIIVPSVVITDLKVANQSVSPSDKGPIKENISIAKEINLDYKQNFALSFVGLNYTSPGQNKYAYKLEGFDKEWNYVGHSTSASYTNLDPGVYVFRVRASNNDDVWNNEGTSIKIYVHPPFWRTNVAYILYACLIIGMILYLRYCSIQKWKNKFRIEQEQKEADRIRELDRLKIKFLTNLSHEFRTPISLILGPVDALLSQQNEKTYGQLNMIRRNAKRLLNLVNQLLDFRKMEEQELTLNESEGELISFIKEAGDSFKDLSERKKICFAFKTQIDQLRTRFDHDKIERILFNILSNAFKFTLEGGKISLELNKMQNQPDALKTWVTIKISDTGIGIPEDKREKIFDRFFQNTTATSILNQGTGIGLSITKEFVQMHGGSIEVQSECGKGTSFFIHLPFVPVTLIEDNDEDSLQKSESNTTAPREELAEKVNGIHLINDNRETPLVLLVEDNEDFRFYLKDNLRLHYKIVEASDGKEGWQKTLSHHPQLIVSDISMPHMNGIELTKKIKADKRTNHIPVILLTALTGEKEQLKGLETGANDYVTKPFNFEVLNAKIYNHLTLNNRLKNTYSKQIKVLTPEVKIESDDEKLLNAIMVYLEENLTNSQLSVEDLSKHVGMSRSSLYNKILELTGQTPVEFIRSVKLNKAAGLLEKSTMNVTQIAYSVGFSTPHYFTKSFKTKYGMLPSEFIARMRKKNGNENEN